MNVRGILLAGCLTLSACSQPINSLNKTAKGALVGAGLGAGTGAIIGSQTGAAGPGIAIGAGLGAVTGAIAGNKFDAQDAKRHRVESRQAALERKVRQQDIEIARLKANKD